MTTIYMKNCITMAFAAVMLTGCVSYNGLTVDADNMVDEANRAYAQQAQNAFVARMKAPARPVVITEAPEIGIFLDATRSPFGGHPLCNNLAVRKEVAVALKAQLRDKVSNIKDFKLVEETQAMVAVGDEVVHSKNYLLTYNVTSLELKENAIGSLTTQLVGSSLGGKTGHAVSNQKFWEGVAKVEVRLFKPDGTTPIFTFTGDGVYRKMIDIHSPLDKTFLLEAVKIAANNAMNGYVQKFGPPMFVTDTCQGGQFAKLNIGAKFGVQTGQYVEFYRNIVREGLSGEQEVSQKVVGNGIVGKKNAPVESNGAWVFIENFDANNRSVFRWTSARIMPVAK